MMKNVYLHLSFFLLILLVDKLNLLNFFLKV